MVWIIAGVLSNVFVNIPFYIKVYFGGDVNGLINMLQVIPGITAENYMYKYILYAVIPFNFIL